MTPRDCQTAAPVSELMYKTAEALQAELASELPVPLSHGDILDACPLVFWADQTREVTEDDQAHRVRARVITLTQACDVANDKTERVVVALVHDAGELVRTGRLREKFIRDQVRKGQVYGWYFLPAHESCPGFPESLVDLRDLHTVPRTVLEGLRDQGQLVCRLTTPYREHLAQHFSVTYCSAANSGACRAMTSCRNSTKRRFRAKFSSGVITSPSPRGRVSLPTMASGANPRAKTSSGGKTETKFCGSLS
jgi:hypothetical protein